MIKAMMKAMIRTVIDIGSNSIKMRIAKVHNGHVTVLRDETEVVRLGRGMSSTGMLREESMKASCEAVIRMSKRAKKFGNDIFIVGTMALRTAKNSDVFVKMVKDSCGLDVHVFSGEEEAEYSWLGAVDGFNLKGEAVMFDSGGGSTEFVSGSDGQMNESVSVPIGAVNLSERFFPDHDSPVKGKAFNAAYEYVTALFNENNITKFRTSPCEFIGVGGGAVTMASVKHAQENFMPSKLQGCILTQRDIVRQIQMYSSLTLKERRNIIGLPASRADVILGSACIILTAMRILNAKSFRVSINGLRHGLLLRDI